MWFSFGLIIFATAVACGWWYRDSWAALLETERARLESAAAEIAALVSERLSEMRLRLAYADSSAAAGSEVTVTRVPLDGSDGRVPLGPLMAAAGSGSDPGRPGLTPAYQLDGQWYAALVAAPDPRGTLAAILPLAGLRLQIDALARESGVDALLIAPTNRIWWTSPLDEDSLDRPAGVERGGEDFLAAWRRGHLTAFSTVPEFGLAVEVRRSDVTPRDLDYQAGALIMLTGVAGLIGCGVAWRVSGPRSEEAAPRPKAPGMPARAEAAAPPARHEPAPAVPDVPFLVYAARPDGSGGHEVVLHAVGEPTAFGLAPDVRRLPAKTLLARVADEQRRQLEDYLSGKGHVEAAPMWLDWEVDQANALVLQHFPFRRPAVNGQPPVPAGLLVSAGPQYEEWSRLEQQAREASAANIRKSRFLARLSHEFRTPLNAIIGFAELMENETLGPVGTPRYKDYLADIGASGRHLHELINDIIDISRVETGELDLSESILPVRSELEACYRFVRERLEAAKLEFVFDVPDGLPKLRADPLRFRQIMLNLLSNAIKFTRPGGEVGISVRVHSDNSLRISVADTGIGMDEAGIRRAMEPFGRVSDDEYGPTEGTGLGLPIARGLMALHGGRLEVESAPGAGTTVNLIFPPSRLIPAD